MMRFIGVFLIRQTKMSLEMLQTEHALEGLLSKLLVCTDLPGLLQVLLCAGVKRAGYDFGSNQTIEEQGYV